MSNSGFPQDTIHTIGSLNPIPSEPRHLLPRQKEEALSQGARSDEGRCGLLSIRHSSARATHENQTANQANAGGGPEALSQGARSDEGRSGLLSIRHSSARATQDQSLPPPSRMGGIHILKSSSPHLVIPTLPPAPRVTGLTLGAAGEVATSRSAGKGTRLPHIPLPLPHRPYEKAIRLIARFSDWYIRQEGTAFGDSRGQTLSGVHVAWLFSTRSCTRPYPPAFEARGLELSRVLFLETDALIPTLQSLCEENFFPIVVAEGPRGPREENLVLRIANRWLKPANLTPLRLRCADEIEACVPQKLFLLMP